MSKVAAGEPVHADHFIALKQFAEVKSRRLDLEELWNMLIGNQINKPFDQLVKWFIYLITNQHVP